VAPAGVAVTGMAVTGMEGDAPRDPAGAGGLGFLAGGGAMGALMRGLDWAATPLGPPEAWPQSLRTAVSTCLSCAFPILLWWGPELAMLYNDEYVPILGSKHPRALGQPGAECWAEIWQVIGPMLRRVLAEGEPTRSRDMLLVPERNGYPEECYFSFSYSPIRDETGGVGGVFTPVIETTATVLGARRLRTLRDLAAHTAGTQDLAATFARAAAVLAENPHDIPFAALYRIAADHRTATLQASTGLGAAAAACPATLDLADADGPGWAAAAIAAASGRAVVIDGAAHGFAVADLPANPWPEPPARVILLPVTPPGQEAPAALLLAGLSPRLALDGAYREFLDLAAGQAGTVLADALAYEEERRRAEALAELDRAKTAFFANVSHEFRTPLTLLLGPLEEQLADPALPGAARARAEVAHRNALRLLRLVNDLLDFSRVEAGRAQAQFAPVDLAALTADLASGFRSLCERAGLRLQVDCPRLPAPVPVDRGLWEKIVLNLLSNAFKFTEQGGIRVAQHPTADGGAVELVVEDTGCGIPAAELPRLFDRFHRVQGNRGRTHEGTGIGLALVRELTLLHGGDVTVRSEPGRGSAFTVRLPLRQAQIADPPPDPADIADPPPDTAAVAVSLPQAAGIAVLPPQAAAGRTASAYVGEAAHWLADAEAAPIEADPSRPRLLIADDNADMRSYIARLLARSYAVAAVADGEAALSQALASPPDLVLADVMMPGLDGLQLVRRLRADPRTASVPVILLSARAGAEAGSEGLDAGADDYLVKPFAEQELLARVAAALRAAALRRAAAEQERALRAAAEAANARVAFALRAARMGAWELDLAAGADQRAAEIGRLPGLQAGSLGDGQVLVHPEDRARVAATRQAAIRAGAPVDMEYRVLTADGRALWVAEKAEPVRAADGTPQRLVGVLADVTERRHAEAAMREQAARRAFLLALTDQVRELSTPHEMMAAAAAALGRHLGASRAGYAETEPDGAHLVLVADWSAPGIPPAARRHRLEDYGAELAQRLRAGRTVVVDDIAAEPMLGAPARAAHQALRGAAILSVPMRAGEALEAVLFVLRDPPRPWTEGEVALAEEVAERSWSALRRLRAEAALRGSEARLRAIFEAAPIGIVVAEAPSGRIVESNRHVETIWRQPVLASPDIAGYRYWIAHHADGRQVEPEEYPLARVILHGEARPEMEVLSRRGDGTDAWVRLTAAPMRDAAGRLIGAVVATLDIDRERRAIAELEIARDRQRLLIEELNHRVKNTLAVVQSLAIQSLRSADDLAGFSDSFGSRLQALARAHDLLTREEWAGVTLGDVAGAALAPWLTGQRIRLDGPTVMLGPKQALALSMAFGELATNAVKHGALSAEAGRVSLRWQASTWDGRPAQAAELIDVALDWTEAGGPPVRPPARRGVGSRLLGGPLGAELGGSVELDFDPAGLRCRFRFAVIAGGGWQMPDGAEAR
jgi:PAS domain S-box-containing protein